MPERIDFVEVSPRDGLQNQTVTLRPEARAELVRRAVAAGVRRVEAVSFVNPRRVPQMADGEVVMDLLRRDGSLRAQGVRLIGLALNARGVERAVDAGVDEVNYVVVASETFSQRNQGASIAQALDQAGVLAAAAAASGVGFGVTVGAAFGCPFEGEVPERRVTEITARLAQAGVQEIALADTIGVADPLSVETRVAAVRAAAPSARLRCHFHNTRNTGLANAFAAWRAGALSLDASIGGVGGCPFAPAATGNIPTEDTAYMFQRMGVETGLDLQRLIDTAAWLGEQLGEPRLPAMLGRAGVFPKPLAA